MTIQECYAKLEGDYEEVFGRFRRETMVQKFAVKFLKDGSFQELQQYLKEQNVQEAFRAAHTLKGVAQNLSFTRLASSASFLTELLRDGNLQEGQEYFETVKKDYEMTAAVLEEYERSKSDAPLA